MNDEIKTEDEDDPPDRRIKSWRPVDIIVGFMTAVIGIATLTSAILPTLTGEPLTEAKAKLISGVIISMISIISMYVGAEIQRRKDHT